MYILTRAVEEKLFWKYPPLTRNLIPLRQWESFEPNRIMTGIQTYCPSSTIGRSDLIKWHHHLVDENMPYTDTLIICQVEKERERTIFRLVYSEGIEKIPQAIGGPDDLHDRKTGD